MSRNVPFCLADFDTVEKAMLDSWPRIYLFGDSLTERAFYEQEGGFGVRLRAYYEGRDVGVVNRGVSGFTSRWLRDFFSQRIIQEASRQPKPPLLITIFLGANDACLPPSSAHVPLPEYESHIRHYIGTVLNDPATRGTRVLLITPPPINVPTPRREEEWERGLSGIKEVAKVDFKEDRGYRTWSSKRDYARKVVEIGEEYAGKTELVGVLDFWTKLTEFGRAEAEKGGWVKGEGELDVGCGAPSGAEFGRGVFVDGLHLGEKGYEVLGREMITLITKKWPELKRENMPLVED